MSSPSSAPAGSARHNEGGSVLILGAGINGAALARELVLSGVGVQIVDTRDLASGATSRSSRLIHGGLRYLEYAEFSLVHESLAERERLLKVAPQYVHPLQLFIPVKGWLGGFFASARKFLFGRGPSKARGMLLVRIGLTFYDWLARSASLPRHRTYRVTAQDIPPVNREAYTRLCSYYDATVHFPERFVLAMLEDARRTAAANGVPFGISTYSHAEPVASDEGPGTQVRIVPDESQSATAWELRPAAIVNATGAWVDFTNEEWNSQRRKLMGPTKGSHLFVHSQALHDRLNGRGIYVEASDGRPIFILPFGEQSMVGTTDIPFTQRPGEAEITPEEIDYLLRAANHVFPKLNLTVADIDWHYTGVRPLPAADASTPGAVTRRHVLIEHEDLTVPSFSIVGGKLTTCRQLGEEAAEKILEKLDISYEPRTRDRQFPGAEDYPATTEALAEVQSRIAEQMGLTLPQVQALWELVGARVPEVFDDTQPDCRENLLGTQLPLGAIRWIIRHEWVHSIDDLVHRRLMLIYFPMQRAALTTLARLLVESGHLQEQDVEKEVAAAAERLQTKFGKRLL